MIFQQKDFQRILAPPDPAMFSKYAHKDFKAERRLNEIAINLDV